MTDERPPRIDPALVSSFVGDAHGDLDEFRALLEREPAASHMHNREIALFLLDRGARMDVFAAAMLAYVDLVRAMLEARPELRDAKGPHGIPLSAHAVPEVAELLA